MGLLVGSAGTVLPNRVGADIDAEIARAAARRVEHARARRRGA
ncbi:MAG: hypothetical protein ACREMB_27725 [Candidatus Rokuibacteriota bacterium]